MYSAAKDIDLSDIDGIVFKPKENESDITSHCHDEAAPSLCHKTLVASEIKMFGIPAPMIHKCYK